ncbi:MAG: bifunctional 4-hydroxy-2-oxoglutarate aldolase/2-dehydro-3-deoxy-phosphogluconate aldolase [Candidatus Marinimicrobia bacterium]|nr:bifunctional 4-hydroxy-2-oxoglutarate aldolase/2-dehydro-3-deoxy-phosphogluconate aldolase [Candidatus Neomarinimicrobiota bacterium]MCF7828911.1 bifunctional 4-hydroxy-2-oxoglutarate aldolase/2-dehydro-3-deoxy-phosphogluconate aldolase [Candidatus Neomarinimicrobiota bacterium]MCF7879871.1 bifunctional 4-hydroxy-2-oxoglutarate aldolase/2-dehydro-3-deoxy-phosphogluconate aldolase [Candidatus Neomarinimicrobiota bacterium]
MDRLQIVEAIEESGVVAVIRLSDTDLLREIIDALADGGMRAIEITMTTPDAIEVIRETAQSVPDDFIIGAGTVLDAETARQAILAGAEFIVSPVTDKTVIEMAHRYDKAVVPGAFTATEILQVWEWGADVVKVFPATAVGPKYFKDIHGPLPQVKLSPTGGVNLDNAAEFVKHGARFLGVGSALLDKKMIAEKDWEGLAAHAKKFITEVEKGRQSK